MKSALLPAVIFACVGLVSVMNYGCGDGTETVTDTVVQETNDGDTAVNDHDTSNPGDFDGTCYDCATVCVNCDAAYEPTCLTECSAVQGYSDGFMWLESQLDKWGCEGDSTSWTSAACP